MKTISVMWVLHTDSSTWIKHYERQLKMHRGEINVGGPQSFCWKEEVEEEEEEDRVTPLEHGPDHFPSYTLNSSSRNT